MMIILRKATEVDLPFLIDCVNKDWEINDKQTDFEGYDIWFRNTFEGDETIAQWDILLSYLFNDNAQNLYIVNNGQKDIGFFTQDEDETNSTVGGTAWVHPRSCKMSVLKIVKAMTLRGALLKEVFSYAELNTWHPLIVSTVKAIVPAMQEVKIRDKYRILHCEMKDVPSSEELISKYNITDIDFNKCFAFDER